jgi:hypothetical protein
VTVLDRRAVLLVALLAAAGAASAAPAVASEPGLLAQWNFDEGAGQIAHDSGPRGLDATLGLSPEADRADPTWIGGASGSALRFDGSSIVRLPDAAALAPQHLTVEAVARADRSPGRYRYLVGRGGTACWSASWGLYSGPTGGLAFYVYDGTRFVLSPAARRRDVWDGRWHRFTGVFDGATLRLFVDGREVGEPMPAPLRIDYGIPHAEALVGQYAGGCDLGFTGDIDSVRVLSDAVPQRSDKPSLPAAAPGTTLPAAPPGATTGSPPRTPGVRTGTTPARRPACKVKLSRKKIAAGRRTVVRARLTGAPNRRKLKLTVRRGSARKPIATARLNRAGAARLVVKTHRAGRLTVRVSGTSACTPATMRVTR